MPSHCKAGMSLPLCYVYSAMIAEEKHTDGPLYVLGRSWENCIKEAAF